jgi:predicted transcriptional regulator
VLEVSSAAFMDQSVFLLKKYLETHRLNHFKNNKKNCQRVGVTRGEMRKAIKQLVNSGVLTRDNNSYIINRNVLSLEVSSIPTDKAVETLKQHLVGKQYLKNLSKIRNQLNLSYVAIKRAVNTLEKQGVLCLHSEHSNGHKIYSINFPSVQQL